MNLSWFPLITFWVIFFLPMETLLWGGICQVSHQMTKAYDPERVAETVQVTGYCAPLRTRSQLSVLEHTCNPSPREGEAERSGVKLILGYTVSLKSAWVTWDPGRRGGGWRENMNESVWSRTGNPETSPQLNWFSTKVQTITEGGWSNWTPIDPRLNLLVEWNELKWHV